MLSLVSELNNITTKKTKIKFFLLIFCMLAKQYCGAC